MKCDQIMSFVEDLIVLTKDDKLEWLPFDSLPERNSIITEIETNNIGPDWAINTIRTSKSFYLSQDDGFVFLFEIYHGNPEVTSPMEDSNSIMMKINKQIIIEDCSNYSETEQEKLEELKLVIQSKIEEKYIMPDMLYDFMRRVTSK